MPELMPAIIVVSYFAATAMLLFSVRRERPPLRRLSVLLTTAAALLHLLQQAGVWLGPAAAISILNVFSLCALATVLLLLGSLVSARPLFDAGLLALPLAGLAVLLEWLTQAPTTVPATAAPSVAVHVFSSVIAFGVLSVAGVYALLASLIDRFLRAHHLNRLVRSLPPLEVLEGLLFQLILAGFILLTISLATGLIFVEELFAQHLAHKTVLSILAWLVFGTLLWGRRFRGWRGRLAVRLTLAGVALLLLSYFGSKLVLEVVLGRSWQT
jgi:ABC-type uncharacterized transport system permease subunit